MLGSAGPDACCVTKLTVCQTRSQLSIEKEWHSLDGTFLNAVNRQKSKQRFIIIDPKRIHFLDKEADPLANLRAERRPELLPWFYTET